MQQKVTAQIGANSITIETGKIAKLADGSVVVSCGETIDHLEVLFETGSLSNEIVYRDLSAHLDLLGRKLNVFIDSIERLHRTNRRDIPKPESRIAHLAS